jgi:hypothetical protein
MKTWSSTAEFHSERKVTINCILWAFKYAVISQTVLHHHRAWPHRIWIHWLLPSHDIVSMTCFHMASFIWHYYNYTCVRTTHFYDKMLVFWTPRHAAIILPIKTINRWSTACNRCKCSNYFAKFSLLTQTDEQNLYFAIFLFEQVYGSEKKCKVAIYGQIKLRVCWCYVLRWIWYLWCYSECASTPAGKLKS